MHTASENGTAKLRGVIFLAALLLFGLLVCSIRGAWQLSLPALLTLSLLFSLLGLAGALLTVRIKENRTQKVLFQIHGLSAVGIPLSGVVHNVVYGLGVRWFGNEAWGPAGDEPFFFILAIIVFPVLYLSSAIFLGIRLAIKAAGK